MPPIPEKADGSKSAIERIEERLGGHPVLLPIQKGYKHPYGLNGWQKTTYQETRKPYYRKLLQEAAGVGVLLGHSADNIVTVDVDEDGEIDAALKAWPFLAGTFQTRGQRGRNFWFRCNGSGYPDAVLAYTTAELRAKDPDANAAELRMGGGHQSVIFGPHKETKELYQWLNDLPLIETSWDPFKTVPSHWILKVDKVKKKKSVTRPKAARSAPSAPVKDDPLSLCLADNILELCEEFFPKGEKEGNSWAIGNEKGEAGQSLRISLLREKAGQWYEFNGAEGHDFLELLARHQGITREDAFSLLRARYPGYFQKRAVFYQAGEDKGLLNFCRNLARTINEVDGEIYNSCELCVIPTTHRLIGEMEVARLGLKELSAHAFKSEIQKFLTIYRQTPKGTSKILALEDARTVLESSAFLDGLHPIRGICDVALPCGVSPRGELLAFNEGYNPQSGILVKTAGFTFAHDWPLEKAIKYYQDLYREFCFLAGDKRRSLAVAIAMNLTLFGYYLLSPNAQRPVFLSDANQEGAGKTLLLKIALIARYGSAVLSPMPSTEDLRQKHIYSAARCRDGVVAWDNIRGEIQSPALEQAVTAVYLNARLLHTQTTQEVRHELIFLLSTNSGSITPDLRRRSLSMELHLANLKAEDRQIKNWLDEDRLLAERPGPFSESGRAKAVRVPVRFCPASKTGARSLPVPWKQPVSLVPA